MTRIIYGVSPIGLGHASRAVAIGTKLANMGIDVEFATGGPAVSFIGSYGFSVHDIITEPVPFEAGGKVILSTLWYLRYWFGYRSSRSRMRSLVDSIKPDIVVGDEEFSSISVAVERKLKHALITDELELGFAKNSIANAIESRVRDWYKELQKSVSSIIIPDFGTDEGNLHYVTPVVREVTKNCAQVRLENRMPLSSKVVLFSMSGSGIGAYLMKRTVEAFNRASLKDTILAIAGANGQRKSEASILKLGFLRDNQNLIAASDLVVSLAGKSTIDEAASCGTPIIAIPLKNHFEQERNASALGFTFEDINRLEPLIKEYVRKRHEPKHYRGAEAAAMLIANLSR